MVNWKDDFFEWVLVGSIIILVLSVDFGVILCGGSVSAIIWSFIITYVGVILLAVLLINHMDKKVPKRSRKRKK